MRAVRYDGSKVLLDPRAEAPAPAPGEAIIRPLRVGLSTFDALVNAGPPPADLPPEPLTLGHEFVGVVESVAAEADLRKRWEGKRVVGSPTIACGKCDMCKGGLPNHCRARRTLGVRGWDGALAERLRLPLRNLAEVPPSVSDEQAVFATPLGAALHAATIVRIEGKPYVTVLGDGVDALLCAQVMVRLNASVRVLGSSPEKFSLCEKWGIKHRHSAEAGRRHDQDIVVDCTGTPAGFALALQLVRPRGKVVLRGDPACTGQACALPSSGPGARNDLSPLVENEIELLGARCGNPAEAIARLAAAEIDVLPLITKRARLADALAALKAAAAPDQLKVVVEI
ncbi:MAG: alcohol dehydrogenase catalytic domain-containing protein [Phycisphaerales bacterium]